MLADAAAVYDFAELLVKVKEPIGRELELLQARHLLFCFLHLAALPELQQRLLEIGLTAVAFETLADAGGLPILAPMSDIAGRLAVQIGSNLLQRPQGGTGLGNSRIRLSRGERWRWPGQLPDCFSCRKQGT